MPELPEVQTITNDLQLLTGDTITGFWTDWQRIIKEKSLTYFTQQITNQKILGVRRIGKFICINLINNTTIVIHLRMTGQLLFIKNLEFVDEKYHKHIHHIFYLQKNGILAFSDVRKFATISLFKTDGLSTQKSISNLGIDALSEKLSSEKLYALTQKNGNKKIKDLLMRQDIISGIGNIYASEILFLAKIAPSRLSKNISFAEAKTLKKSIVQILKKAIRLRGTSVSDYRDSLGNKGSFQNELKVYKKHGQKCQNCDILIEKTVIGQRSTFHCPKCQN